MLLFLVAKQFPEMRPRAGGQTIILFAVCFGGVVYGLAVCFHAAGLILRRSESAGLIAGIVFFLTVVPALFVRYYRYWR